MRAMVGSMKRVAQTLVMLLLLTVFACAKQASTNPAFMSSADYQARESLGASLFTGDQALISNEDIEKILSSKIDLPDEARLVVLRFGPKPSYSFSQEVARLDQKLLDDFMTRIENIDRIQDVSVLPTLLMPEKMTIPHIRASAARFQAHYVLIYRSHSDLYEKYHVFKRNQVRAYSTVELVLLDVRTGTVPFSAVVTEDYTAERSDDELRFAETYRTAERTAVHTAMTKGAEGLVAFLDGVPE